MESKNYLLLVRTLAGYINEKVTINTDIDTAKNILMKVMDASKSSARGEIIEGNRDFIGDFRVKPLFRVFRNNDGCYIEEAG